MRKMLTIFLANLLWIVPLTTFTGVAVVSASAAPVPVGQSKNQAPQDSGHYEVWLANQVQHQLLMLPWYSVFDNLEYRIEGNKVILSGEVVTPTIKSDAESAVKHIEGVQEVDNQIEVLPVSNFDNRIRWQELRTIYSFPSLQRYGMGTNPSIHILVKNGHVTLEGVVDNQADKDAAGIRANSVPNVFSVTNNLRVGNAG
jgi:hyperosmotically inducible periplasmic protein